MLSGMRWFTLRVGWTGVVLISLVATLLACRWSGALSVSEFAVFDVLMRMRPPAEPSPEIVLVGITREEIENYDELRSPECACELVPRSRIGNAIKRVKRAGARVVTVDLMFSQVCPVYRNTPAWHDKPLIESFHMPVPTVIAANTNSNPDWVEFRDPPEPFTQGTHTVIASPVLCNPHGIVRGVSLMQHGLLPSGTRDNIGRHLQPVGTVYLPLCMATYAAWLGVPYAIPEPTSLHQMGLNGRGIPVWSCEAVHLMEPLASASVSDTTQANRCFMLINWVGPPGSFPTYPIGSVLDAPQEKLVERFGGKIVVFGSLADRGSTPMGRAVVPEDPERADESCETTMSGLEMHANAIDTLLRRRFIRHVPSGWMWVLIFGLCLSTVASFRQLATWLAVTVALGQIAFLFVLAAILIRADFWLFSVTPSVGILLTGAVSAVWAYSSARREAIELAGQVRARDAITRTLAHDLKQPLAAIGALAVALRTQQSRGPIAPELIDKIQEQVSRAIGDIDELLNANPDRELDIKPQEFDLAKLARDLATTQAMKSDIHRIEVSAPEVFVVEADPRFIARAISNLLDNAIKYWPEGGTVTLKVVSEPPDMAGVHVIDGGIGIPHHFQDRIFEAYERGAAAGSAIEGTGIGLYSVRRIAEAHGGSVSVDSAPGAGSRFTFRIAARTRVRVNNEQVAEGHEI
ncbi:MAG: CHASE2 domain-containing protein [Armatimonadetes bacterium]|nr:CHASE2 domain-containing protein [Armatimonadota bacterium]